MISSVVMSCLLQIIESFFNNVRLTNDYERRKAEAEKIIPIVEKYSEEYDVDPILVTVIIREESGFNPHARGKRGEIGVMQVMPHLFAGFDLSTVDGQIKAGVSNLRAGYAVCGNNLASVLGYYGSGSCKSNKRWIKRRIRLYKKEVKKCRAKQ